MKRIAEIYGIEKEIRGRPAEERLGVRQEKSRPLVDKLHAWFTATSPRIMAGSATSDAMKYALKRWGGFTRFLDDGRIELDNNTAERAIRPVATTDSYYTSSSNVRKQGLLVFHFDATRASVTRELGHFVLFQVRGSDLVRRIGYNLLGREHALLDHSTDPMGSNPKLFGGFGQREPLSILFGGSVAVDFVDSAQRADTARCPGLALSGLHSHPVESGGNVCIGPPGVRFLRRDCRSLHLRLESARRSAVEDHVHRPPRLGTRVMINESWYQCSDRLYLAPRIRPGAGSRYPGTGGETARRLQTIPGVGPLTSLAVEAFAPPMESFRCGRDFAAWLGLVPRQFSSGGKERLGRMSKAGQSDIRRLLIIGAMSRLNWLGRKTIAEGSWLARISARKPRMLVAIALANKMARTIWAMLTKKENYRVPAQAAAA